MWWEARGRKSNTRIGWLETPVKKGREEDENIPKSWRAGCFPDAPKQFHTAWLWRNLRSRSIILVAVFSSGWRRYFPTPTLARLSCVAEKVTKFPLASGPESLLPVPVAWLYHNYYSWMHNNRDGFLRQQTTLQSETLLRDWMVSHFTMSHYSPSWLLTAWIGDRYLGTPKLSVLKRRPNGVFTAKWSITPYIDVRPHH